MCLINLLISYKIIFVDSYKEDISLIFEKIDEKIYLDNEIIDYMKAEEIFNAIIKKRNIEISTVCLNGFKTIEYIAV